MAIAIAAPASAQNTDTAAERARLANERIRQEAERRAEAERERQAEQAARAETRAPAADLPSAAGGSEAPAGPRSTGGGAPVADRPAGSAGQSAGPSPGESPAEFPVEPRAESPRPPAAPAAAPGSDGISRTLEQLRELGELRDAGYVTDEEFERIKARILDTRF